MGIDIVQLSPDEALDTTGLANVLSSLMDEFHVSKDLTLILTDDAHIQQLNRDYRHKDMPTDVLSFDMRDDIHPTSPLGEVYISLEQSRSQAKQAGHSHQREVLLLSVHGTLHLLGFEHDTDAGYEAMRHKELLVLSGYDPTEHSLKGV